MWTAPAPEGPWTNPVLCTGFPPNGEENPTIWHLDVVKHQGRYFMLAAHAREDEPLSAIYLYSSHDGITWTMRPDPALVEGIGGWDNAHLYRGCMAPSLDGKFMRVWYGGRTTPNYEIGLTHVPVTEWPMPF